jgi:hypothetical protein
VSSVFHVESSIGAWAGITPPVRLFVGVLGRVETKIGHGLLSLTASRAGELGKFGVPLG